MIRNSMLLAICVGFLLAGSAHGRREKLDLKKTSIELPGAPSTVVPADLNHDGHLDLVILVAFTEWDQIGFEESTEMDGIEGLVEVMTIVPALADRREIHAFLALPDQPGEYREAGPPMELDSTVLALEPGPTATPVLAIVDGGLAALQLRDGQRLELELLAEDPPVLARSGTFVPRLGLLHDLDGDQRDDYLFPAADGLATYLSTEAGFALPAASRWQGPTDKHRPGRRLSRHYPLPTVRDLDGDGLSELLFPDPNQRWEKLHILRNQGAGRFATTGPFIDGALCDEDDEDCPLTDEDTVYFGDIDGDGKAEYITQEGLESEDAGMRQELKEAKQPPFRYRIYRSRPDLSREPEHHVMFDALGYSFDTGGDGFTIPGGFQDLDGDGRLDLISLTLDFSMMQVLRVMTTHSLSIGLDFHLHCQTDDGQFRSVAGTDLSGKFKINLDNVRIHQLSQFDGDFDGDGRADFVQMGRGKTVTIHRGQEGCVYPAKPDLVLKLKEAPRDLALVRVDDLDGDGLSDLSIVQPQKVDDAGVTPPVRLDLYLSSTGGGQ